jgi:hypothetical protein
VRGNLDWSAQRDGDCFAPLAITTRRLPAHRQNMLPVGSTARQKPPSGTREASNDAGIGELMPEGQR